MAAEPVDAAMAAEPVAAVGYDAVVTFATVAYAPAAVLLRHSAVRQGARAVWTYTPDTPLHDELGNERDLELGSSGSGGSSGFSVDAWLAREAGCRDPAAERGYGFWAWKPRVILDALLRLPEGATLLYCDAAVTLEAPLPPLPEGCWAQLFEVAPGYPNSAWTHARAMALLPPHAREAAQVNAGLQMYRRCP